LLKKETLEAKSTTGYGSSIDALNDLRNSGQIAEINSSLSHLANGVAYSFVEVTCSDGTQCGLQAYGNEALELHRAAFQEHLRITSNKK
jgi:hypothetical protein